MTVPLRDGAQLEIEFTEKLSEQIRSYYSLSSDASITSEQIHAFFVRELSSALDRL